MRSLRAVHDLSVFRRFLSLLASRHGQVLNRSDLAGPLGLSVPTVSAWLRVLETTGQVVLVPPYFENFGKRLIKSPRFYWLDSGLVRHLLGLRDHSQLEASPFLGPVFDGAVAAELLKLQVNAGRRRELYFFRDERGLEVDFIISRPGGKLALLEAKASKTVVPADAGPMNRLGAPATTERWVVHGGTQPLTVAPGVRAVPLGDLASALGA